MTRRVGPALIALLIATSTIDTGRAQGPQPRDATSVLAAARVALGGEARLAGVKTFIATGRTRQVRGDNLVPIEFEIQAELPDTYSRRDEFPAQDAGPSIAGFVGNRFFAIPRPAPTGATADDEAAVRDRLTTAKQDFARLLLGLFALSSSSVPLTFSYAATAEAPQGSADVLDVAGPAGFASRLFISRDTHLPIVLTWRSPPTAEQRLFFGDHRDVGGLRLPFRIRRATGTETIEETTFDRFRINAKLDPRRFETSGK